MDANEGHAPSYGGDALTREVRDRVRDAFEAPEAEVHLVATGGAANTLALSTLSQPWDGIFCTAMAHVAEDECNGVEFLTGGAKIVPVPAPQAKLEPQALRRAIAGEGARGVHGAQRGPVSITQATEKGTVYAVAEVEAVGALAREFGLPLHMDGARFANALVAANATPAAMTWRAGVDALSFGGTKNGLMGVEAVVLFDPARAWEFELRRKRSQHLLSKQRFLAAQMLATLADDLWLTMARAANDALARLVAGLRAVPEARLAWEPEANLVFVRLPRRVHARLFAAGASYHLWDGPPEGDPEEVVTGRLVCGWSTTPEEVDRFLAVARA